MKIEETKYTPSFTVKNFLLSKKKIRIIKGPVGCMSADTLIQTDEGLARIDSIRAGTRVLSFSGSGFEYHVCGNAHLKGKDYLYRISMPQGEFVCAGHHRVFCADRKYRFVRDLCVEDKLAGTSLDLLQSAKVFVVSRLNGSRWKHKPSDFQGGCGVSARRYGQLLHFLSGTSQAETPLSVDDLKYDPDLDLGGIERKDGFLAQVLTHNHHCKPSDRFCRQGYLSRRLRICAQAFVEVSRILQNNFSLLLRYTLRCGQYLRRYASRHTVFGSLPSTSTPDSNSLIKRDIISIIREDVKREYWDIHVPYTNNYVISDGTIHHNSGKSVGCIMAIARECSLQLPGPDGVRRSRWAIIRNTQQQLMDTTLKTWLQWFPDGAAGRWMESKKTFFLKFDDVEAEIMFRPLDTAADASRLLSLELTSAYFNETREIASEIFDAVQGRIGRYPAPKDGWATNPIIICDTNPPDLDSWLYQVMEEPDEDMRDVVEVFHQPGGLDPLAENKLFLRENYYEDMVKGTTNKDFVDVHVHGNYGKSNFGKPVHPMFSESRHTARGMMPEPNVLTVIGMDFGLTPAAVFKQMDGWGRLNTFHALWAKGVYLEKFLKESVLPLIFRHYSKCPIIVMGDPSGTARAQGRGESCFDVIKSLGLKYINPDKISNDPSIRMGATDHFLSLIAGDSDFAYKLDKDNCDHLVKALRGGYRFNKKRDGNFQAKVDKTNPFSHVAEASEYGDMFFHGNFHGTHAKRLHDNTVGKGQMERYQPFDKDIGY